MINFFKKHASGLALALAVMLCLGLLIFSVASVSGITGSVNESAAYTAGLNTCRINEQIVDRIVAYRSVAESVLNFLHYSSDSMNVAGKIRNAYQQVSSEYSSLGISDVMYANKGVLYDKTGSVVDNKKVTENLYAGSDSFGTAGVFFDNEKMKEYLAIYLTVPSDDSIDRIVLITSQGFLSVVSDEGASSLIGVAETVSVCDSDGKCLSNVNNLEKEPFELGMKVSLDELLFDKMSQTERAEVRAALASDDLDVKTVSFSYNNSVYYLSVKHNDIMPDYCLVTVYGADAVNAGGDQLITNLASAMIVLFLVVIGVIAYAFIARNMTKKRIKRAETYNEELKCLTVAGLYAEIPTILAKYSGSQFAVVSCKMKYFDYIKENFGKKADEIVAFICATMNQNLELGECFAYLGGGEFVALLHFKEMRLLVNRVRALGVNVTNGASTKKLNVKLRFGVYAIDGKIDRGNIDAMINNATIARDDEKSTTTYSFVNVYSDRSKGDYMNNAEIETRMEFALEHEEFKVFFQPQFNAHKNRIAGCEALVRWYDEETENYRLPGVFMPLFEQNGFIIKLDRYVYYKVCEFIGLRLSEHLPVFPTSVNISRLTALSPDFIDYYVSIKKKFSVPDRFITLEFTESVASESYETLNTIAKGLHQNGFLCSIDDFGSGYASFNILKNMNVDEIKMDRAFLEKGLSAERDRSIVCGIVMLAHELSIKVVQEGVETAEQLAYVKETRCDIIQGYYYSRPLHMLDYIKFMEQYGHNKDEE